MNENGTWTGMTGVIEMGSGNYTILPSDVITFESAMVRVQHMDLYRTESLYPLFTVRMIRWHDKDMERKYGRNKSADDLARQRGLPSPGDATAHQEPDDEHDQDEQQQEVGGRERVHGELVPPSRSSKSKPHAYVSDPQRPGCLLCHRNAAHAIHVL